jgi:hypothetical protein
MFGEGTLAIGYEGVEGQSGLQPRLILKANLVAKGYGIGAVVQITADVTACNLAVGGNYELLGTSLAMPYVLNWVKQTMSQPNPPPPNETIWSLRLPLPLDAAVIEGLEERRQGKDFSLQIDTQVLMVDRGISLGGTTSKDPVHYEIHPILKWQEMLFVTQADWAEVLHRWERGVSIPLVVPLPEAHPGEVRSELVQYLRKARQKIDSADYSGSIAESRKALELLRTISPAQTPLPKPEERDVSQRLRAIIDALFSLASADPHTDPPVKNYVPSRGDAVLLVAGSAAVAQDVFARLQT